VGYGQFGEEAKLNLPEEIKTLRSTVKVVGNNVVMTGAEGRIKARAAKGDGEDEDDDEEDDDEEGPESPFSSQMFGNVDERRSLGASLDGMKSEAVEGEDEEPDSPSSSEAPSSSCGTRPIAGVRSNSNSFQVDLLESTLKESNSEEELSNAVRAALKGKGSEKLTGDSKHKSTRLSDDLKISEGNRTNEGLDEIRSGGDTEEKSRRRVSRRKMYRASRIETPLLKGALEEVVRLSLEEDKVTEQQRERDEQKDEQGHMGTSQDGHKLQRRARRPTPALKNARGETASSFLLGKGKSEEQQAAGSAMPSFDVLAGEFLKASVVLETAEADVAERQLRKEGGTSISRGDLARAASVDDSRLVSEPLEVVKDEYGTTETLPENKIPMILGENVGLAAAD